MYDDPTIDTPVQPDRPHGFLRRIRESDLDLRNTWQIMAGALMLPLGLALIVLGWSGAAHGRVDQQQIPYLVSGGLGGLAIVLIGCFFFWAHWLYRLYDQADVHHQEMLEEQREMMRELVDALGASGQSSRPGGGGGGSGSSRHGKPSPDGDGGGERTFVATPTGTNFHTAGCPMVANRTGTLRTVTSKQATRMKACRVCEPLTPPPGPLMSVRSAL